MYVRFVYVGFVNDKTVVLLAVNSIQTTATDYCCIEMFVTTAWELCNIWGLHGEWNSNYEAFEL